MTKHYYIQFSEYFNSLVGEDLFSILGKLLPIEFIFNRKAEARVSGLVISNAENKKSAENISTLAIPPLTEEKNNTGRFEVDVEFSDDPEVPFPFRGSKVATKLSQPYSVLTAQSGEKVLASSDQGPIWLISENEGVKHFRSALFLPSLSSRQNFSDVFNGECFLEMLILLQFFRSISNKTEYQHPPLRAGFIIDDPNLHWPSYGFVDYREIVNHAQKEKYHVSFATIPLDVWFTHEKTAEIFRANPNWISLLIHGNDHGREELAQNYPQESRDSLLHQAVSRIRWLEQRYQLNVSRVMVPPHGACSEEILAALPKHGFEAACISAGSLRFHNQTKSWTKTLGFFPAETIQGCPVMPRWGLTGNIKANLLVAAYLGQPMILRGHHQDFKEGVEVFDEYARLINGLGNVYWSNMADLSRLNYRWRIEGTECRINPLGRKVNFQLPSGVNQVILESPTLVEDCEWQAIFGDGKTHKIELDKPITLSERDGSRIGLVCNPLRQHTNAPVKTRPTNTALFLRRILTEGRDRLLIS